MPVTECLSCPHTAWRHGGDPSPSPEQSLRAHLPRGRDHLPVGGSGQGGVCRGGGAGDSDRALAHPGGHYRHHHSPFWVSLWGNIDTPTVIVIYDARPWRRWAAFLATGSSPPRANSTCTTPLTTSTNPYLLGSFPQRKESRVTVASFFIDSSPSCSIIASHA